jgi:hypothetical protein
MSPTRYRLALVAAALCLTASAQAGTLLSEGFDAVGALASDGWLLANLDPDPSLPIDWFQGQPYIFESRSGEPGAYIASNFGAAAPGTTLANWLITPTFSTAQAGTVTFWLRGAADADYVDSVRFGFSDGSGETGQFALADAVTAAGEWTRYTVGFAAGGAGSTARFAIEQTGSADLADYVGVDDLSVDARAAGVVPEPATWLTLAVGLLGLATWRRRAAR